MTAIASTFVVVACSEGGAIEESVVRPGITAITQDGPQARCSVNASTVRTAIDAYTLLEGDPPVDEQALVDAGFLRQPTTDWDVVDGELVAENPACGTASDTQPVATVEIVTVPGTVTAEEVLESFDRATVDALGGQDCARELAQIMAAAENFVAVHDSEPRDIAELVDSGALEREPESWELVGDELVPTATGGCNSLR